MEPFQILGNKHLSIETITSNCDLFDGWWAWELRDPMVGKNFALAPGSASNYWHWDGSRKLNAGLILWSNMYPTEVKLQNGSIVTGDPFDVVLIDNRICEHRTPPAYVKALRNNEPVPRWFIRHLLDDEPTEQDITYWKEQLNG